MLPGWSIFRPWPTSRGKTKCFIWAADLIMGSMAFCISGGKQYRQQRAAFWAGLCICRQHCAVNGINVRKIIRCLLLPQFAVRHPLQLPDSSICRNAKDACPCYLLGICSRQNLFLVHEIPIRLHTVLVICRSFFLAQQLHVANLLLEHIHEIRPVI